MKSFRKEITEQIERILKLSEYYPKKVQRTVSQLLAESGKVKIAEEMKAKMNKEK